MRPNTEFFLAASSAHEKSNSSWIWAGAALVHNCKLAGTVVVSVSRDDDVQSDFNVEIDAAYPDKLLDVDCVDLFEKGPPSRRTVASGGYISFTVRRGRQLFRPSILRRIAGGDGGGPVTLPIYAKEFDGGKMGQGDVYSTVMTRPGKYKFVNVVDHASFEVEVKELPKGEVPKFGEKIDIELHAGKFVPHEAEVMVLTGLVFKINAPADISIESK